jgi:PAS domain S-box-containing protein
MAKQTRIVGASKEAEISVVPAGRVSQSAASGEGGGRGLRGWRSGVRRYVLVVGVVGAATALRWALDPLFGPAKQFLTFYPMVAVAALVGGARAGLMATVLSALAVDVFFQEPRGSPKVESLSDWVALGLFVMAGGLMSWMAERVDRARRREAAAAQRERAERLGMLEAVFQSAPSFLHVLRGPEFVFEFANEAYYRLVGRRELLGRPAFEALPEAAQGGYQERIARVLATREPFLGRELPVMLARTPGAPPEERLLDLVYLPLLEPDGTCLRVLGHGTDVTELVRARQRVEEEYRSLFAHMLEGFAYCRMIYQNGAPSDFLFLGVNGAFERLAGLKDVVGRKVSEVVPGIHQSNPELLQIYGRVALSGQPERFETYVELLGAWFSISVFSPQKEYFVTVFDNITKRKQTEANQALLTDVLRILNRGGDLHPLLREVLSAIRDKSGFEAVGLRLRQGEDCPYFEQSGFSQDFLREENFLCAKGPGAAILRDAQGQPVLECTCGLVLAGRTDPKMSCFSQGGSFWTNTSSELLALAPQEDPRNRPRNRCIHTGYQSVGLFPVRAGQAIVGLLQLNDRRPGRFTPESLAFYELLAQHIGFAVQRTAAEGALRESEERFRCYFELGLVGLAITSPTKGWLEVNDELCAILGYDRSELVQKTWAELTHPDDLAADLAQFNRVLAGEMDGYTLDKRFLRKDGRVVYATLSGRCLRRADHSVNYFVVLVQDITERKRAEEASARLAGIVEWSDDAIVSKTLDGVIQTWNAGAERMFGYRAEEVIGRPVTVLIPPERLGEEERVLAQLRRGEPVKHYETVRLTKDGRRLEVSLTISPVKDSRGRIIGAAKIARDIGEVVRAREALARSKEELERLVAERTARLQEMVGELEHFSYTITHDLKSPLRAMRGFAEIAGLMCGEDVRKEVREALGKIATSAERMDGLIADALNYSRSVRQELPLTDVDTGALLRGMVDSYPELQPSRAQIQVEGALPVVVGNEAGLTQCFSNLLGNAVKFAKRGEKPHLRVWAQQARSAGEHEGWARIWVEDKGIGISKEMLPRVFDMFSRGSKDYEGTGIGLALVRKVVQRMGGRLGVEAEEGKGSRFWIELKLGEVRAQPAREAVAPAEPQGGTVLYVEDEESDAMFMKRGFAEQGMESALRVVGDGRAAIEYLSGTGKYADRKEYPLPSVVLLDLNLPQVPGFEVLKWIRRQPEFARMPVVVFSSSTREDDRVKALELGANEFVGKPSSGLKFGEVVEGLKERLHGMEARG